MLYSYLDLSASFIRVMQIVIMALSPYFPRVFTLPFGGFLPTLTKSCWLFHASWSSQGRHRSAWW